MSFTLTDIGCKLEPLPNELWKAVDGTTGYYVSNMGRLLCRNWKNKGRDAFMKPAATAGDNSRRSAAAGRFACVKGSNNPFSKLNEATVKEIRTKFYGGMTRKQLGEEYGVAASTIKDAILRRWKHVA